MKACVVIPCYDHAATVGAVAGAARAFAPVVVVDDGSAEPLPAPPGAHLIRLPRNRGKAAALRAGFAYARQEGFTHAVTLDADGQHAARDIPKFLELARRQPEAVLIGARDFDAAGAPPVRRRANALSNFWFRVETGLRLNDTQCGFRCYPLALLQRLPARSQRYAYELELLVRAAWCGVTLTPVPVGCTYTPEQVRRSHLRPLRDVSRIVLAHGRFTLRAFCVPPSLRAAWAGGQARTWRETLRGLLPLQRNESCLNCGDLIRSAPESASVEPCPPAK